MDGFLGGFTAAALAVSGFMAWRLYDGDVRDAPGGWRDLPRARRRAIRRAVLRGETVLGTPAELLLAGGVATAFRRRLDPARLGLAVVASGLCAAYWTVAGLHGHPGRLVLAALWRASASHGCVSTGA